MNIIPKTLSGFIDFVLPPVCLCCESPLDSSPGNSSKFICPKCYSNLEKFDECHPWREECIAGGIIDNSLSVFWFREGTKIQTLMHEMKYGKMKSIGRLFGQEIGAKISCLSQADWHYIIPVPLHKARKRDRHYNQSEYIARGITAHITAEVLYDGLLRTRFTGTQTKLNKTERKENVKEAFKVNSKFEHLVKGKNIIVADDVITTGATILECAGTLKRAGAARVWVCSAAYAELSMKA